MYILTMLLTKRHALFLALNAALIFINFHIWGYHPGGESRDVIGDDPPRRHAYDYESKAARAKSGARLPDIDPAPERTAPSGQGYVRRTTGSRMSAQDVAPSIWRAMHRNESVVRPLVDAYAKPTEWRTGSGAEYTRWRRDYRVPDVERTKLVDCSRIVANDPEELAKAERVMAERPKVPIYEETYQDWLRDCYNFRRMRGYVEVPLTPEEERYPLAFGIAMYRDVESTERLLRAIYRPNNLYCIHVDTKSSLLVHRTLQALAACFDNVWIASHLDKVKWATSASCCPISTACGIWYAIIAVVSGSTSST